MRAAPTARPEQGSPLPLALAATVVAALPAALVGGVGVELQRDLGISAGGLGAAVSSFFGASAISSAALGHFAERVGVRASFSVALAGSATAMLGIAGLTSAAWQLVGFLALAGLANALMQPSVNGFLADATGGAGMGLAFGVKQSAIPLAALLSGISVPALALTLGWRGVFAAAAILALVVLARVTRLREPRPARVRSRGDGPDVPARVALLGLAAGLGAFGGTALSTFAVSSAVANGFSQGDAGLLLAGGSLLCVLIRVLVGIWVDRTRFDALAAVAFLLLAGSLGFVGLAGTGTVLVIASSALAFGAGWGWPGVFQMAVVARNPQAPRIATGITQTGTFAGATAGPFVFGAIASTSYSAAWLAAAGAVVCSALLVGLVLTVGRTRMPARP